MISTRMQELCPDLWGHISSYCDDATFCALRCVLRGLPHEPRRARRSVTRRLSVKIHETACDDRPRSCAIPYCYHYAIRHVLWEVTKGVAGTVAASVRAGVEARAQRVFGGLFGGRSSKPRSR